MFKKLLVVSLATLLSCGVAFGGSWNQRDFSQAPTGNEFSGIGSENNSNGSFRGYGVAGGLTGTDGKASSDGYVEGIGVASSFGKGKVNTFSSYGAIGFISGEYDLYTSGVAFGKSGTLAGPNSRTWAEGGSFGQGSYNGQKDGRFCVLGLDIITGSAFGKSGTLAGAYQTDGFAAAGAVTGSMSGAKVGGEGNTNALGTGEVSHQTFASQGTAWAATQGYASYEYNNNGGNAVIGGGLAATGGFSKVTQTPTSVSVHSRSFGGSFSSGGQLPVQIEDANQL